MIQGYVWETPCAAAPCGRCSPVGGGRPAWRVAGDGSSVGRSGRPAWLVAAGSRPGESRPRPAPRDAAVVAPHTELERTPRESRRGGSRTDLGSSWIEPRARV
jgi:hypothetical protein